MKLGRRLRQLRKEKGLTLRSLAEAAGVEFTYLSKIENEKSGYSPGADTIRELAKALGVDSLELLRLADKVPPELQDLTATARPAGSLNGRGRSPRLAIGMRCSTFWNDGSGNATMGGREQNEHQVV